MTTVTNLTPWAYHGIFDCANCNSTATQTESTIRAFMAELASTTSSGAIGETYMAITGSGDNAKEGFSAVQLIETGTITAKIVNSTNNVYLDIVSCKEYTGAEVVGIIKKYISDATTINKILLPRNANAQQPQ